MIDLPNRVTVCPVIWPVICPVGDIDQGIPKHIMEHITRIFSKRFGFACELSEALEIPGDAFNEARCQYNSKTILKQLRDRCPRDSLRIVGITPVDLYVPILKYVYGLAQIEGKCGLISLHRLRPQFYDQPADSDLLLERVEKTALHELGHTFGLTHCRDRKCIMYSSTRIEDTDFKASDFCPTCFELMKWQIEKS